MQFLLRPIVQLYFELTSHGFSMRFSNISNDRRNSNVRYFSHDSLSYRKSSNSLEYSECFLPAVFRVRLIITLDRWWTTTFAWHIILIETSSNWRYLRLSCRRNVHIITSSQWTANKVCCLRRQLWPWRPYVMRLITMRKCRVVNSEQSIKFRFGLSLFINGLITSLERLSFFFFSLANSQAHEPHMTTSTMS